MSNKNKVIELIETDKNLDGYNFFELKAGAHILGKIIDTQNHKFIAIFPNNDKFIVKSHREALSILIRNYHLHS